MCRRSSEEESAVTEVLTDRQVAANGELTAAPWKTYTHHTTSEGD
jgi:hypothetical protein